MNIKYMLGLAGAGLFTFVPHISNAAIVNLVDNLADNLYVSSGGSISGYFDISGILAGNNIVNASFTVIANDDGDVAFSNETYDAYTRTTFSPEEYRRTHMRFFTDEPETSVVAFEGTTNTTTQTTVYGQQSYTGETLDAIQAHFCGFLCASVHLLYTDNYDIISSGYTGSLSSSGLLGPAEINAATMDGLFNFVVAAPAGDFILNSVILTLETSPIPVPAAVWLFGAGLIGLTGVARRNSRTKGKMG